MNLETDEKNEKNIGLTGGDRWLSLKSSLENHVPVNGFARLFFPLPVRL
jgi:hypothetical protein